MVSTGQIDYSVQRLKNCLTYFSGHVTQVKQFKREEKSLTLGRKIKSFILKDTGNELSRSLTNIITVLPDTRKELLKKIKETLRTFINIMNYENEQKRVPAYLNEKNNLLQLLGSLLMVMKVFSDFKIHTIKLDQDKLPIHEVMKKIIVFNPFKNMEDGQLTDWNIMYNNVFNIFNSYKYELKMIPYQSTRARTLSKNNSRSSMYGSTVNPKTNNETSPSSLESNSQNGITIEKPSPRSSFESFDKLTIEEKKIRVFKRLIFRISNIYSEKEQEIEYTTSIKKLLATYLAFLSHEELFNYIKLGIESEKLIIEQKRLLLKTLRKWLQDDINIILFYKNNQKLMTIIQNVTDYVNDKAKDPMMKEEIVLINKLLEKPNTERPPSLSIYEKVSNYSLPESLSNVEDLQKLRNHFSKALSQLISRFMSKIQPVEWVSLHTLGTDERAVRCKNLQKIGEIDGAIINFIVQEIVIPPPFTKDEATPKKIEKYKKEISLRFDFFNELALECLANNDFHSSVTIGITLYSNHLINKLKNALELNNKLDDSLNKLISEDKNFKHLRDLIKKPQENAQPFIPFYPLLKKDCLFRCDHLPKTPDLILKIENKLYAQIEFNTQLINDYYFSGYLDRLDHFIKDPTPFERL